MSVKSQDEPDLKAQANDLLQSMTVPERVGQLFLITFEGDRAPNNSTIADLVLNYHIGGVALLSENDNLTGYGNPAATSLQVKELTSNLQRLAIIGLSNDEGGEEPDDGVPPTTEAEPRNVPIPLLIATGQDGDSLPVSNVLAGFTDVPNNMALGATWEPAYAQRIGQIVGRELSAAGINLLLGPSLDVLERPSPLSSGDLGSHSFGGDPYWVGLMGRAYIEGAHSGSDNRLAIAARSFPGKGSSDRPVDEEVPTVRRSLDQLKQIELAPFFAVTRDLLGQPAATDALVATHIRYQGLQGNIRATTAPISLDPQALNALLALPELSPWRGSGGVMVSDALGVRSVQRFYDDTEREFPHRQVAKDALLAGNDLLYVANFARGNADEATQLANVKDTIIWFRERYETDPPFRQRVDEAVMRILELKLRLYEGDLTIENVLGEAAAAATVPPPGGATFFDIAESAIALLAPSAEELSSRFVSPPGSASTIVIFTDVHEVQACSSCESTPLLSQTALQERILALYGPSGSGQVQPDNITSFSFAELNDFLDAGNAPIPFPTAPITPTQEAGGDQPAPGTPAPTPTLPGDYRVQEALRDADWLVFALLNAGSRAGANDSQALSRFLSVRPDLASKSQVVVLAFDAPYFLDSTEISKLTAYYGVFSRTNSFVDAAVRALFLESTLGGASPVSVEGIQYDLFTQTQPDPDQVIELFLVIGEEIEAPSRQQPLAAAIGDTLRLQTGVVTDRNGRQVPDGTLVRFNLRNRVQGTVTILGDRPTTDGIAQLDYVLDASMGPGQFRITAESGDATLSQEVDIVIEEDAQLAIIIPTSAPTATATPSPTPTETPRPTNTPQPPSPTATPPSSEAGAESGWLIGLSELRSLLGVLTGLLIVGFLAMFVNRRRPAPSLIQQLGRFLWGVTGGLLIYNYYALGMPGSSLFSNFGSLAGLMLILAGGVAGLLLYRPLRRS
jgi:beta-N-acetylhexosaminidase